jgi:hypothetical protein
MQLNIVLPIWRLTCFVETFIQGSPRPTEVIQAGIDPDRCRDGKIRHCGKL